jgi:hypothetical protein
MESVPQTKNRFLTEIPNSKVQTQRPERLYHVVEEVSPRAPTTLPLAVPVAIDCTTLGSPSCTAVDYRFLQWLVSTPSLQLSQTASLWQVAKYRL